jgi:hypothetical protein
MKPHHDHTHKNGAGHNSAAAVSQWQTPHEPHATQQSSSDHEPDLDLVEDAFVEGFARAPDPTSFLRLAGVPLAGSADGRRYCLLRVEISQKTDVGSLSPYLGGSGHRYDPLPAALVYKRETLTFSYFDGEQTIELSLGEARQLDPASV